MLQTPRPERQIHNPQSLKRAYEEYVEARIEEFKDQLSRDRLMDLADEAVRELECGEQQLVLTEILLLDHVDQLIIKRLKLPSFRRWQTHHLRLRLAQREATHWGIDARSPLATFARCSEDGDLAAVVGGDAAHTAFFLAAHDWDVMLLDQDISVVQAAQSRANGEVLSNRFHGVLANLGTWFPEIEPTLVVFDPYTLGRMSGNAREHVIQSAKERTRDAGAHVMVPAPSSTDADPVSVDVIRRFYDGWETLSSRSTDCFVARKRVG